ncbi:hypothetical protein TIFTF001_011269 [Ficus carica]|uniref:Uncharacterized protein n=1 Tax=Ficus carica TaxID=3494 RepID=A0AA87ZWW3_FICCA|nr:hypothetical protein TIFTF001_011269 [Ficus carica]
MCDQQLDLISKLYAVLRVVAHVFVDVADLLDGCDQRSVLAEPPCRCSRTGSGLGPSIYNHSLSLLWSALIGWISLRLLSEKSGLLSGYFSLPSDVFICLGMPPSDPSQVHNGGWPVVDESPDESIVFDTFSERLYQGVVRAALDLHYGFVEALEILFECFDFALLYTD